MRGDETVILRGLTAIPDPNGGRHQVLLGTCHYPGVVYRIDPGRGRAVTTELDIRAYFAKAFGVTKLASPCMNRRLTDQSANGLAIKLCQPFLDICKLFVARSGEWLCYLPAHLQESIQLLTSFLRSVEFVNRRSQLVFTYG